MNKANVIHAVEEAKRFQYRAAALLKLTMPEGWTTYQGQEAAAVRRSSMDLTKALAQLRKPPQW